MQIRYSVKGYISKTKKIRSTRESTVQRKQHPTTFYNGKHLKGWTKIPIPKQLEDEHIEKKNKQIIIKVLGIA